MTLPALPPRGSPMIPGTFVLPGPREEGGRLVFREPLRDTLVPLAAVGTLDFAACLAFTASSGIVQAVFLVVAAALSFLVVALAASLLRRPEVVLDRAAGRIRIRRPESAPMEIDLSAVRAVTLGTASGAGGITAPAAGLDLGDGRWLPLHVGWSPARGGDAATVRARGEAIAAFLGLPLEEGADPGVVK